MSAPSSYGHCSIRGAAVAVPSRPEGKLRELRTHLAQHIDDARLDRLHTFVVDLGDETGAKELLHQMTNDLGAPDAVVVVAALGKFVPASSLFSASTDHLRQVLRDYLIAHFAVARTFMPSLQVRHGAYVFINGSLAFEPWKRSGAGLVSIATAAQHMLFRALAQEVEGSRVRVVELVTHAIIRDRQTQPSSSIPGEAVGTFTAYLVSERAREMHAHSVQLRSIQQSKDVGLELGDEACC